MTKTFILLVSVLNALHTATASQSKLVKRECEVVSCVQALAPTVATCAEAVAFVGANIAADVSCLVDAINQGVDPPEECNGCGEQLKDVLPQPVQDALDRTGDVVGNVKEKLEVEVGCPIVDCILELGGVVADCVPAVAQGGLNLVEDATCLQSVVEAGLSPPDSCKGCGKGLADKIPQEVQDILDGLGGSDGEVKGSDEEEGKGGEDKDGEEKADGEEKEEKGGEEEGCDEEPEPSVNVNDGGEEPHEVMQAPKDDQKELDDCVAQCQYQYHFMSMAKK